MVVTGLVVLFLGFDAIVKVLAMSVATEPTVALGVPERLVIPIGVIELTCLALYVVPRTSVLGAVVLTGYLGGAAAIQLRAGNPAGLYVFPVVIGALAWAGLWMRDGRLRAFLATQTRGEASG